MKLGRIKEIKILLNGKRKEFEDLEKWFVNDSLAVAKWIAPPDNPHNLPVNTYSWGVWTMKLPHITTYRIHKPNGELIKYRFDVIENLTITDDCVSFHDLLLDAYLDHSDLTNIILEDEDEVEEAIRSSKLTDLQIETIAQTKTLLTQNHPNVLQTIDCLINTAIEMHE